VTSITLINAITAAITAVAEAEATLGVATLKANIEAATATGRNASSAENPIAGQPATVTKNGWTDAGNEKPLRKATELTITLKRSCKITKIIPTNITISTHSSNSSKLTKTIMKIPKILQLNKIIYNIIRAG
jgi:hypothetical protein